MPETVTVTEEVVAPMLHDNAPVAVVDNTELPQLLLTVTGGAEGTATGAAVTVPEGLLQPFTVCMTE